MGTQNFSATTGQQPVQKAYTEDNNHEHQPWAFNEPAIYYSAGYIKLLAHFVKPKEVSPVDLVVNATNGTIFSGNTSYAENAHVTLTALADPGFIFHEWTGDAEGNSNSLSVLMDAPKAVTANFEAVESSTCLVYNAGFEEELKGWIQDGISLTSTNANSGQSAIVLPEEGGVLGGSLISVGNNNGFTFTMQE